MFLTWAELPLWVEDCPRLGWHECFGEQAGPQSCISAGCAPEGCGELKSFSMLPSQTVRHLARSLATSRHSTLRCCSSCRDSDSCPPCVGCPEGGGEQGRAGLLPSWALQVAPLALRAAGGCSWSREGDCSLCFPHLCNKNTHTRDQHPSLHPCNWVPHSHF